VWRNGRREYAYRVVWEEVHGPAPDGLEVCHTCDNGRCVAIGHLFLGTHAENMADMKRKGRAARNEGEWHGRAKLTGAQVTEIRSRYAAGATKKGLGRAFGVSPRNIRSIVLRETWRHL